MTLFWAYRPTIWHWLVLLLVWSSVQSPTAQAYWEDPSELTFGTAYTLPERRMRIGIVTPMSYGVHDRVTLSTHPIMDLLLAPNAAIRVRLMEVPFTMSIAAAYNQSFFPGAENDSEGHIRAFLLGSAPLTKGFIVTVSAGIDQNLSVSQRAVHATLSTHVRMGITSLLVMQAGFTLELEGKGAANGLLLYATALKTVRLGIGVAVGPPLSLEALGFDESTVPVWPYADVWWVF
ncbi:MAG: hypothetical protein CMH54_07975 [Myxococcales bacterium]|nr:hypothetical protein [Myxococcales bacterium]|tara:strand:+ start:518 stop:1219 length:702 start_codon:yes stop_codon:yes gene_type:complete